MTPATLRARRVALGLSQTELAELFGVTQQYVSLAETRAGIARAWYGLALRALERVE